LEWTETCQCRAAGHLAQPKLVYSGLVWIEPWASCLGYLAA